MNAIRPEPTAATDDAASDTGVGSHGPSVADDHVLSVRTGRMLHETNERLARARRRAEELANHDALTGCLNRRRMLEMLAVEVHRARRGVTFSVCLVDLDHFKAVNDEHGHLAGDEVLKRFAAAVQSMLRPTDFLARYGGEEFLVGLPQTSLESAVVVAERIQAMIEQTVFPGLALRRGVTVSIGVAEHQPAHTVERTLERVDDALYEAKAQGRNTVRSRPA